MTTTSGNIAGTVQPFVVAGHGTRPWPYGSARVFKIDEIKPGKKKKREKLYYGQVGMLYLNTRGQVQEAFTEPVGKKGDNLWKIPSLGKIGVWRTVRGKRHFFPVDGSSPIPKIRGGEEKKGAPKGAKAQGGGSAPKKKGILGRIMDKISSALGGGGGAASKVKDVKGPSKKSGGAKKTSGGKGKKGKKEKKAESKIPGRDDTLNQTDSMILKASRSKSGKRLMPALKGMQAALRSDDPVAFKKAEASLAKATKKLAKKKGR